MKQTKRSGSGRKPVDITQRKVRAALSNGTSLMLRDVDGRLAWARRLRDLVADHTSDLGGDDNISASERVLLKRAAMLTLQLEMLECRFAEQDGMATTLQLNDYQRALNTCRRVFEALGLRRRARDVTPSLGEILKSARMSTAAQDHRAVCERCGTALPPPKRGQAQKFCSTQCRKAAFRASLCVPKTEKRLSDGLMRSAAPAAAVGALEARETARKIVSFLKRLRFIGRISPTQLALLVPRGIALAELNLDRGPPLTAADLTRALNELHIADYPQREASVSGALRREEPEAPAATLLPSYGFGKVGDPPLQGDDYPLEYYDDGFPKLPACLDRRRARP